MDVADGSAGDKRRGGGGDIEGGGGVGAAGEGDGGEVDGGTGGTGSYYRWWGDVLIRTADCVGVGTCCGRRGYWSGGDIWGRREVGSGSDSGIKVADDSGELGGDGGGTGSYYR